MVKERNADRERAELFRKNLLSTMMQFRKTVEQLGSEAGLDRDGRKWLKRIHQNGLARPNKLTSSNLDRLAKILMLGDGNQFWNPNPNRSGEPTVLKLRWLLDMIDKDTLTTVSDRKALLDEINKTVERWWFLARKRYEASLKYQEKHR